MTTVVGQLSCVYPGADVFIISFYSNFFFPSTDRMDFHKELHEEMSHPLGPTATAVQSLTVFSSNYKYLVVCILLFFQKSAMATAHVKMSHSLPTSQTLS